MTCESGWTGDRCRAPLHHDGPHTNDSLEVIVGWLEQQEGATGALQDISRGFPAGEMLAAFHEERKDPRPRHTSRGEETLVGWPYGRTHDADCPGCIDVPYAASPRSEAYWSS